MAIQNRRGQYADFDPSKAVPGELLTVLSGDPNAKDGKAVYMTFASGDVKRMATYEDMVDNIEEATEDVAQDVAEQIEENLQPMVTTAQTAAQTATTKANEASQSASSVSASAAQITTNKDDISDLKSALDCVYDGYHKLSFATVENEYPTPSGTFLPYNNYRRSDYIPLNGADALYINNTSAAADNIWYDADKNPISAFRIPIGEPAVLYPPSNAEYAIISNWATAFYSAVYVDVKNAKADTLSKLRSLKSLNYDIVDGEYYRAGTLYTSTAYKHYRHTSYIDVSDFDKVVITAEGEYSNDMYLFFDKDKTFLSSVRTDTTITLQEVPIPSNVKYIIVCSSDKSVEPFVGAYLPIVNDILVKKTALKSWLLIGDSLTDETNDTSTKRYFEWLKEPTCTTTNIGVSGSGYLRNNGGSTNNFVSKVDELTGNEGYDIISVFGGINDSGNFDEYPLGNFGDTTPTTYYGAIYYVFNSLITKFPTAFIFAITPSVPDYRHGASNGCDQLADAIKEVCRWLKVPVADVNATCGLRPWITGNQSKYYFDGVHPNAEGHKLIANCVRGVFQYMID